MNKTLMAYHFLIPEWIWAVKLCKTAEREIGGFYKGFSSTHERGGRGKHDFFFPLWFKFIKFLQCHFALEFRNNA